MTKPISYKDSGVDIEKGDQLVERIKKKVRSTYGERVKQGVGGFACLYDMGEDRYLAAGTDGVGTKLKLAQILGKHDTIGIDLVAMCVNDILCTGAKPLFFMDYLATGKLDVEVSEAIIDGVVEGCKQSECALIGGETAEMPGMYGDGEYDLAGFAVGEVTTQHLVDGSRVTPGDSLIGLPSSGIHSNGFSLVRKVINENEKELLKEALTPTTIYWNVVKKLLEVEGLIKGMAHITGGGIHNIARVNSSCDYHLTSWPDLEEVPPIFKVLKERTALDSDELYKTFNMGVGLVLVTERPDEMKALLSSLHQPHWEVGSVVEGAGSVTFK